MYSMSDNDVNVITFCYFTVYLMFLEGETTVTTSAFTEDIDWRMKFKGEATLIPVIKKRIV